MRMSFARFNRAISRGGRVCQSLAFFCCVNAAQHIGEEVSDVEAGTLKVAQLICEKEIKHRTVFIFFRETANNFIGDRGARCLSLRGNRFSFGVVFSLSKPAPLPVSQLG